MSSTSLDGIIGQNREQSGVSSSSETTPAETPEVGPLVKTGEGGSKIVSDVGEEEDVEGGKEPAKLDGEPVYHCGWFGVRPRWIQRFMTPKWALFWLCWAGAVQGGYNDHKL